MSKSSVFFKYPPDSTFGGKKVLNAGCGFAKFVKPNVVNLDAFDTCDPDVVADLNKKLPFKDETFDHVIANHIMEHLTNFWGAFNELSRVLKTGGVLEIWVPADGSDGQMGFRDHVRPIDLNSFYGIQGTDRGPGNAWAKAQSNKKGACRLMKLDCVQKRLNDKWWMQRAPTAVQMWMMEHLRNITFESGYFFKKTSGEGK